MGPQNSWGRVIMVLGKASCNKVFNFSQEQIHIRGAHYSGQTTIIPKPEFSRALGGGIPVLFTSNVE